MSAHDMTGRNTNAADTIAELTALVAEKLTTIQTGGTVGYVEQFNLVLWGRYRFRPCLAGQTARGWTQDQKEAE